MINVMYQKFPAGCNSVVVKKGDDYTILINPNIATNQQRKAYKHELKHIEKEDLERDIFVNEIEGERNE